jgi:hypothetical protein
MGYTYFDASCLCAGETAFVFREKTFYSCETTRTGNFSRETSHTGAVSRKVCRHFWHLTLVSYRGDLTTREDLYGGYCIWIESSLHTAGAAAKDELLDRWECWILYGIQ